MADVRTMEFELPGFGGELLRPADATYDDTRSVFNGMIDRRPAVIARATSADDVAAAVNGAREQDIALSIYGGGHGVTGSAVVDAGICLDLRTLNRIDVDPDQRTARVEGGRSGERSTPPPSSMASPSRAGVSRTRALAGSRSAAAAGGSSASSGSRATTSSKRRS